MQSLGEGTLNLHEHRLEDLVQREPLQTKVRLKSPKGSTGGGGVLHISIHFDSSSGKNPPPPSHKSSPAVSRQSTVGTADAAAAAAAAAAARNAANGGANDSSERRSRAYDANGSTFPSLQEVPEHDVFETEENVIQRDDVRQPRERNAVKAAVDFGLHTVCSSLQ
jgi:hypothetical protein